MSAYLAKQNFESSRNKIRTALYGESACGPRMMHDGVSLTFRDAIIRHGGEAAHITKQFDKLKREDQEAVIEFLRSL